MGGGRGRFGEELEEKRSRFGDMATLCTEIGMPKYRANQKKRKRFLPGNIPANICHRQGLVCEGACALCSVRHQRAWLRARSSMWRDTYSCCVRACASVYTTRKCVCAYVTPSEYLFDTRVFFFCFVFFNVHPKAPLLISCAFLTLCYAEASVRKVFSFFFTHTPIPSSSCAYRQV